MNKPHPRLKKLAGFLEEYTLELSQQVETLLKRHGKEIHLKQFAQKRVADIVIDLYAMYCVLSRVTASIEANGEEKAQMEIAIAEAFFSKSNRRIRGNFKAMNRNEDELMKFIAEKSYELGGYPYDVFKS
jgi:acyl-CoA dehydrogenase family protein 9